jgi:prepilin-type N-terminal cleavage/methylation domain-containing protein
LFKRKSENTPRSALQGESVGHGRAEQSLGCTPHGALKSRPKDEGFTLVELLIVTSILPMIVGALSVGMIAVFSLNSGVSSRLSNTADAQVVSSNYQLDIQGAAQITTASSLNTMCGPSTEDQVLGVLSNFQTTSQTVISYVYAQVGPSSTWMLERLECDGGGNLTVPSTTTVLANNLPAPTSTTTPPPSASITCVSNVASQKCSNSLAGTGWVLSQYVSEVTLAVTEPQIGTATTGSYMYNLTASPAASSANNTIGSPVNTQATTTCDKAATGTGPLANNLCFVDFTPLSNASDMAVAETPGSCLEMSATLGPNYNYDKLFFCLNISEPNGSNPTTGATPTDPQPWPVPTYSGAFFGNLVNGQAFYTGIPGDPAIYERVKSTSYADLTTLTFSNITVVTGSNALATNWAIVSADAESTDATSGTAVDDESLVWTTNTGAPLTVVPNDIPSFDGGASDPYYAGNACLSDQSVSGLVGGIDPITGVASSTPDTVTCNSTIKNGATTEIETGSQKTGAAMVMATTPSTMTIQLISGANGDDGLQGIVFGMYLP